MLESDDIYGVNIRDVSTEIMEERTALAEVADDAKVTQVREIWSKCENYTAEWLVD